MPVLWLNGLAILAAVVPLWQARSACRDAAGRRLRPGPGVVTARRPRPPTPRRRRSPLTDGRLALVAGLTLLVILAIGLAPTILREQTRDWIAYEQAADRLTAGEPLYVFELATPDDEYYLYPPPMAAIWAAVGSPELLFAVKIVALARGRGVDGRRRAEGASAATLDRRRQLLPPAALIAAPNLHDLVLGNVMALYVGAVAVSVARPGWLGASPLGVVCAVALKPAIGPYLLWLAIRRPRDFVADARRRARGLRRVRGARSVRAATWSTSSRCRG